MQRSKVDLPEPLGPRMTTTLPLPTVKLTPFKASTPVKAFLKLLTLTIQLLFSIGIHSPFQNFDHEGKQDGHGEVHHSQGGIGGVVFECAACIKFRHLGNIPNRQDRHQGGVFQERDEIVPQGWEDILQSLGQDDIEHCLRVGHALRSCRFHLTWVNGLKTCTEDLSQKCAVCDRERDNRAHVHGNRAGLQPLEGCCNIGQPEVLKDRCKILQTQSDSRDQDQGDKENQYQHRNSADDFNVKSTCVIPKDVAGYSAQAQNQSEDERDRK